MAYQPTNYISAHDIRQLNILFGSEEGAKQGSRRCDWLAVQYMKEAAFDLACPICSCAGEWMDG